MRRDDARTGFQVDLGYIVEVANQLTEPRQKHL
jgi:hypothetical protein